MGYHKQHAFATASERVLNEKLRALFARRGFEPARERVEVDAALSVGSDTLGGGLVPAETVLACEARTGRCFYVRRDEAGDVEGFIALLYLSKVGYDALMRGRFDPSAPKMRHLTDGPDEPAEAIYVWCLASRSDEGRRALVRAVTEARRRAFPHIALFARPVSREGRMMTAALDAPNGPAAFLGWVPVSPEQARDEAVESDAAAADTSRKESTDGRFEA